MDGHEVGQDMDSDTRFFWISDSDKVMKSDKGLDQDMSENLGHGQTSDTRVRSPQIHTYLKLNYQLNAFANNQRMSLILKYQQNYFKHFHFYNLFQSILRL